MRDLRAYNAYQHLLLSALALVHEEDLVAILRAARKDPGRNRCIDLVNAELDKGMSLMEAFAAPSPLHEVFTDDWPEFRVYVTGDRVSLDFGTNGPPSSIVCWQAQMAGTGVVAMLECLGGYYPEGIPEEPKRSPKGWSPLDGLGPGLQ